MIGRPAVFLDRDGVLNEFVADPVTGKPDSPHKAEDVELIDGAGTAAARLAHAGFALICISNQPAAAKGTASIERLLDVHRRVTALLAEEGAILETSRLCWHHPDGIVPDLAVRCSCRKPEPGMLMDAARATDVDLGASWMVGDTDIDVAAGRAAGCRTVLIEYESTAHKRSSSIRPDLRAADLDDAVTKLLAL